MLAVVPMFHANAWGLPYSCMMVGAKQVFPGPHLDPPSLLELLVSERVTVTAGVPTIWLGMLQILDDNPRSYDLSALRADGHRRLGRAAQHDRRLSRSGTTCDIVALLGHDRAVPDGHDRQHAAAAARQVERRASTPSARSRAGPARWSRSAPATKTASSPGTAQRWASWKSAGRGSPAATTNRPDAADVVHRGRLVPHRRHRGDRSASAACTCRTGPRT